MYEFISHTKEHCADIVKNGNKDVSVGRFDVLIPELVNPPA